MINGGRVSEDTKNLVEFIRSLPSAKNIRVYSHEQCQSMNMSNETAAVRRSVIRLRNQK
jgi:hypothetical protein